MLDRPLRYRTFPAGLLRRARAGVSSAAFDWPDRRRVAVSLTFDDGRVSQIDRAVPVLDRHRIRASFYVSLSRIAPRATRWREAVAAGHEIGNHTVSHPCSGNFPWSRRNPLEDYTLERMEAELRQANDAIRQAVGIVPRTFAYPCGQTYVGRGEQTQSYVPLINQYFLAGRGFLSQVANDPTFCDLAHLNGIWADGQPFELLRQVIDRATEIGAWVILCSHDVGRKSGYHATAIRDLEQLCRWLNSTADEIWTDTVASVATWIRQSRQASAPSSTIAHPS